MPIKQPESGLTVEQYNKLTDPDRIPAWKVIAKRYNLKFDVLDLRKEVDDLLEHYKSIINF